MHSVEVITQDGKNVYWIEYYDIYKDEFANLFYISDHEPSQDEIATVLRNEFLDADYSDEDEFPIEEAVKAGLDSSSHYRMYAWQ